MLFRPLLAPSAERRVVNMSTFLWISHILFSFRIRESSLAAINRQSSVHRFSTMCCVVNVLGSGALVLVQVCRICGDICFRHPHLTEAGVFVRSSFCLESLWFLIVRVRTL